MAGKLRYAIVGSGMMGHEHIRNIELSAGGEVVAIADPHGESRWWAQQVASQPLAEFDDVGALLDGADVDAVVVSSPNHTHRDVLEPLFETDLHVLCEKPLCTTVADARWAAERAAKHGGVFWVGMEYRYMAPVERLLEEVRSGHIGALKMLAIREHRFPFLPKVGDWNRFARNTGGTFVEKCCHFFDLMRLVAGDEATRVYASAGQDVNHLDERYDGETPDILDNGYVVVDFRNGVRAMLDLCMFAEASPNEQEITATGAAGKVEVSVPDGRVFIGTRHPFGRTTETCTVPKEILAAGSHFGATYFEHLAFQRAVADGLPAAVTAEDGLHAVAIGAAAELSAEKQQPVDVAALLQEAFALKRRNRGGIET